MTEKLDTKVFVTPAARAAQSGIGINRQMMIVNKINEIIESLGSVATDMTVAAINTQMTAVLEAQNNFITQLNALTNRVSALEIAPAEAIPNTSETVQLSAGGLLNLGLVNSAMNSQAQTINKMLTVMRNRKEIKT